MKATTLLCVLISLAIGLVSHAFAQGTGSPTESKYSYNAAPNALILQLSYSGGRIANRDPTPYIRVFGDGRVLIYRTEYMKNAGLFETRLTTEELKQLLDSFADEQILSSPPDALRVIESQARTAAGPSRLPQDHGARTNVDVQFESIAPTSAELAPMRNVNRRITLQSSVIETSARTSTSPMQTFSAGVKQLEALSKRSDLVKVPGN